MPCIHFGRKFLPMLDDQWPVWTVWCVVHCFGQFQFSARIDCIGELSREGKNLFEVSSRDVLQGHVAMNEVSCACCCPCSAFGGWADIVGLQLSAQRETQEEKLPSDGWEWRLRVNSQFGNVNVTSIINNPTVKEKNCCKQSCGTGKWQAKLKFHSCHGLAVKVLWYTPGNATINSLVI